MTVVAAYTDGVSTWIGSDTCAVSSSGQPFELGPKWAGVEHGWWFGHCGDCRAANLVEAAAPESLFDPAFTPMQVANAIRDLFVRDGFHAKYENDVVPNYDNSGIIARAGQVWDVDGCFCVVRMPAGALHARGSGGHWATAAAFGVQQVTVAHRPAALMRVALDAAARFDVNIRGQWTRVLMPRETC